MMSDERCTFEDLVQRSKSLRVQIPTRDNRVETIAGDDSEKRAEIVKHAKKARVIVHHKVLDLIEDFLRVKRTYGSPAEKRLYEDMNRQEFVERLFLKRAVTFYGPADRTLLRDGTKLNNGKDWLAVGGPKEDGIKVYNYLSYDEMQLSALIGASTPTYFINNGNRQNGGVKNPVKSFQECGVIIALVGARFKQKDKMEFQHIIVSESSTPENGFGRSSLKQEDARSEESSSGSKSAQLAKERKLHDRKLLQIWAKFYEAGDSSGHFFPSFEEVVREKGSPLYIKVTSIKQEAYFNLRVFQKRMRILAETFLMEANCQGEEHERKVFAHVVGFGLGIWRILPQQGFWLVEAFVDSIRTLNLPWLSTVHFSWFPADAPKAVKSDQIKTKGGNLVKIEFSKRNTADPIHTDELLVTSFAWDSNCFPGNEYWMNKLSSSSDSAAASCCTIPQLLNPYVNPFHKNVKVLKQL